MEEVEGPSKEDDVDACGATLDPGTAHGSEDVGVETVGVLGADSNEYSESHPSEAAIALASFFPAALSSDRDDGREDGIVWEGCESEVSFPGSFFGTTEVVVDVG